MPDNLTNEIETQFKNITKTIKFRELDHCFRLFLHYPDPDPLFLTDPDPGATKTEPDPGGQKITDPYGSGSGSETLLRIV